MRARHVALTVTLIACSHGLQTSMARASVTALAACRPASEHGAAPGINNRDAFQRALNAGCLDLRAVPGDYGVISPIPVKAGAVEVLVMPPGSIIVGDGAERIVFSGDPAGRDWRGIHPTGEWKITGVDLAVEETGGNWQQQSPLLYIRGPLTGGEIADFVMSHPVVSGSSRGDCIQIVGYPPNAGGVDARVWDIEIHHGVFAACARSSVSIHSGLHGHRKADGHSTTRIHHTAHFDTSDQDLDEEGSGDIGGIDATDIVEWDHNLHRAGPSMQSAIAISVYPGSTLLHHNIVDRAVSLYGGSHELHHNVVTLTVPTQEPVVYVRKVGTVYLHDEIYSRPMAGGTGAVLMAAQKITSPTVRVENVRIAQHTAATPIGVSGVSGFSMIGVDVVDDGPPGARDAVRIEGTDGATGVRTTPVEIADCTFVGKFRAIVSVSGSYAGGVGALTLRDNAMAGAIGGLRCENIAPVMQRNGLMSGGVMGPLVYEHDVWPAPSCAL